jgi:hypothetical protein
MRLLVLAGVLLITKLAHAQPSEPERLYQDGQHAYDAGRYDAAVDAWQRSYALSKLPDLLFNLGQAYRLRGQPGDCTRSIDAYRGFVAANPASTQRPNAEGFIAELAACADIERTSKISRPTPSPTTSRRIPRATSYLSFGVGIAGVAIGAYYHQRAASLSDEVTAACASGCTFADVADRDAEGRRAVRRQYVFYGIGAAGVVAGGALYWLSRKHDVPQIGVAPTDRGAIMSWHRTW